MASENETIADIIAEMCRREKSHCYPKVARNIMHQYAARIEAAWKRESRAIATEHAVLPAVCITKPSGNAAAIRKALLEIETVAGEAVENGTMELPQYSKIVDIAESALSAPARNCDVGTAEEQEERYLKLKREHVDRMARCPAVGESFFFPDSLYWAQMPYEAQEGGAK